MTTQPTRQTEGKPASIVRSPREMLELLVYSIKISTEDAFQKGEPLLMVYNYHSVIVQEAVRVLDASDIDRPLTEDEMKAVKSAIGKHTSGGGQS